MRFAVLGPLAVFGDDDESLSLGGPRQRSVLALLLLQPGRVVPSEQIVTEIWGDEPPPGARDSLYTYVSNLRGIIGRDRISRIDSGYRLDLSDVDSIDAVDCTAKLVSARRLLGSDATEAGGLIDTSLSSWRGRPYEGFEDLASVLPETVRLDELRLGAVEDRIEADLLAGGTPDVGDVATLTDQHPYRERLWELLARSLYRAGRQAEALRTFTRLRRLLGEELGIEPSPALARVEEQILLQDPALDAGNALPPSNLPTPVSSFVGRVDELMLLDKAIHEHRLVTVVAPGGAGKTRLATAAGQNVRGSFPDGVWLVDLARVSQPEGVVQAVAATLQVVGVPGEEVPVALAKRLSSQRSLIVLDNCEHVIAAAGDLAIILLEAAPGLKILATSREPLGRTGEVRFPLAGLGMAEGAASVGDAERLFEQRATEVRPDLIHDDDVKLAVASICRHLDGMPLAIELAAARVDTMSPAEIDRHLSDRFSLLADTRVDRPAHQSLQASLDWSYSLLTPAESSDFDCLGIFGGPFGVAAAAAVLGSAAEVGAIDRLRRLVNVSLVQSPQPGAQYRLLETVRMFAMAHLIEGGALDDAARRHDRHYVDRCRALRGAFFGRDRVSAQAEIVAELPDYHAAFDRQLAQRNFAEALEMAWPLCNVWLFTGRRNEASSRMGEVLEATQGHRTEARADALSVAAFFDMYVQKYERAIHRADEAIDLYRALGDEQGLAYALARRGHLAFSVGAVPEALDLLQQSLDMCARIGYDDGSAWPLTLLAQARLWSGDGGIEVQRMFEEGRERFIAMGDVAGQAHANMFLPNCGERTVERLMRYSLETMDLVERSGADPLIRSGAFHNLAFAVWHSGDHPRAEGLNHLAAKSAIETGMTVNSGMAFLQAAEFAGEQGAAERAAILYGAGDAHFVMQKAPFYEESLRAGAEAATQALGSRRYEELRHKGAAMSIEEATAFLLEA